MILAFNEENYHALCDEVSRRSTYLGAIVSEYGYPPLWTRPNSFETLVLTILEQQVSLASAYAAYKRLKERIGKITPQKLLPLTDEDLRSCYFSRQKMVYVRELAAAILAKKISLKGFEKEEDDAVRQTLIALKGIGHWTIDIYLLHALQRTDIFPLGDLALVNALKMITGQPLTREEMLAMAEKWTPYRSIATTILWHYYIRKKNIKLLH